MRCAQRITARMPSVCSPISTSVYVLKNILSRKKYTLSGGQGLNCLSHLNIGHIKNCQITWSHLNKTSAGAQQRLQQQLSLVQIRQWGPPLAIVECSFNYLNIYYFKSSSFSSSHLCFLEWCGICTNKKYNSFHVLIY